jgi:hypothetical protein
MPSPFPGANRAKMEEKYIVAEWKKIGKKWKTSSTFSFAEKRM